MSNKKDANRILKELQKKFTSSDFTLTQEDSGMFFIYTNDKELYDSDEFVNYIEALPDEYDDIVFMYANYKEVIPVVSYKSEVNFN